MKSRYRKTVALRHEINVTPFVDVMLVLLVIFMVATPMMQSGVSVDLPRGQNSSQEGEQSPPLNVSLDKTGQLFLREKKVTQEELIQTLQSLPPETTERIYIRGDRSLPYERIMQLMSVLAEKGFSKLNLVTEQAQ
jgi:biopolymer transport protein TolR